MRRILLLLAAAFLLGGLIWSVSSPPVRYGLTFMLLWLLPGLAWSTLFSRNGHRELEPLVVGLGLGIAGTCVMTLLISYLPGPMTRLQLLTAVVINVSLPLVISLSVRQKKDRSANDTGQARPLETLNVEDDLSILNGRHHFWQEGWGWLLIAMTIAVGMRVVNVGYAEFQGDEATVLTRAAHVLEGDETTIFQHKKGPAEITVAAITWQLTGMTSEWMARLPFAWASVLGVATVFLWGRQLKRPHAGGITACLLATEGYLVGFGRIVQYQSLVFALSALGLLCLLIYYRRGTTKWILAGAVLFASGALAHYDAILALPAGLLLIGARIWRDRRRGWRVLLPPIAAGAIGIVLAGVFYAPFLYSPYFEGTSAYLSGRLGGGEHFYNHFQSSLDRSAVYDAVYLMATMLMALAAQVLITWQGWGRAGVLSSSILITSIVISAAQPNLWVVNKGLNLAWLPAALLLAGSLLAPGQSLGERAAWLWLGIPALFYLFFVARPLTHIYTAVPAWAMTSGLGLANLGRWLNQRSKRTMRVIGVCGVTVYALCGYYTAMMFVDHTPEYRRTFPQHKHPLYWTPYDEIPEEGLFGFPYRAGWKVVGYMIDQGYLPHTYDSNEEPAITDWYTHQALRLDCASPEMYIIAANVQDEIPVRWDQIEAEYHLHAIVTVEGQPKLKIYRPDVDGVSRVYRAKAYTWAFDRLTTPARSTSTAPTFALPDAYTPLEASIGDFAKLIGYRLKTNHAVPGGYVELTLLWQAQGPAPIDYQVFTHLYDGKTMQGQLDGEPVCDNRPTSQWKAGETIIDPYRIPIKPDAPPGPVPLTVGMYNLVTMERLPVSTPAGASTNDSVHLTEIEIREP